MIASGGGTALGALGLLALRNPSRRVLDAALGFTGGVMLAATAFSLLVPALDRGGITETMVGFAAGALALLLLDAKLPHTHPQYAEPGHPDLEHAPAARRAKLLLIAMTIHNVPEGLAVGAAFAAAGPELGIPTALAIGLQNIPEGFAVGAPLLESGTSRLKAMLVAGSTGLVEPVAAVLAVLMLGLIGALPAALGFAAGAMVYVVVDELIPESHASGNERTASVALLIGFAVMVTLDNAFV
jgi:ZIP family zinc transporter